MAQMNSAGGFVQMQHGDDQQGCGFCHLAEVRNGLQRQEGKQSHLLFGLSNGAEGRALYGKTILGLGCEWRLLFA